jgi:hypothetical protein
LGKQKISLASSATPSELDILMETITISGWGGGMMAGAMVTGARMLGGTDRGMKAGLTGGIRRSIIGIGIGSTTLGGRG